MIRRGTLKEARAALTHLRAFSYHRGNTWTHAMKILLALALIMTATLSTKSYCEEELTYCRNYEGEVVIVTDYHCPSGFWPL